MKFRHKQKVKINKDYYKTYKGHIQSVRTYTDKSTNLLVKKFEYQVKIIVPDEDSILEWIPEENLDVAWF